MEELIPTSKQTRSKHLTLHENIATSGQGLPLRPVRLKAGPLARSQRVSGSPATSQIDQGFSTCSSIAEQTRVISKFRVSFSCNLPTFKIKIRPKYGSC
jgi:hypothetical protein